jgi:hypothetical protein
MRGRHRRRIGWQARPEAAASRLRRPVNALSQTTRMVSGAATGTCRWARIPRVARIWGAP